MKTIVVWLLVSVTSGYSNSSPSRVEVVERFDTKEDCQAFSAVVPGPIYNHKFICIGKKEQVYQ